MTALVIAILVAAAIGAVVVARFNRRGRERFIDAYEFPRGIRERVHKRYPHLSPAQLDLVFVALRDYFHLCRQAGKRMLAMPSQVVDAAWHEFILFTRNYEVFCRQALGRFLHHTPAEAMRSPREAGDGLKRTWRLACARRGIHPVAASTLPLLFAIDADLRIADGFHYALDCAAVAALHDGNGRVIYCGSHIGCGGGCAGSGCSGGGSGGDGGDGGGCGGGGGD
jgi:hypothetical protein